MDCMPFMNGNENRADKALGEVIGLRECYQSRLNSKSKSFAPSFPRGLGSLSVLHQVKEAIHY